MARKVKHHLAHESDSRGGVVNIEDLSGAFLDEMEKQAWGLMRRAGRTAVRLAHDICVESDTVRTRYRGRALTGDDAKHLRDTLTAKVGVPKALRGTMIQMTMGAKKFTGPMVEWGTKGSEKRPGDTPGFPFIEPALTLATKGFEGDLADAAERIKV